MRKVRGSIRRLIILLCLAFLIPLIQARATTITVTSNPLWTDTGIFLLASQTVTFSNSAANWCYAGGATCSGPGGTFLASALFDEWITDFQHGQLIGFIGTPTGNLNNVPRVISQNDPGLFVIGATTVPVTVTGLAGELWLGFNDDYATNAIGDNSGTATVDVNVNTVPEPSSLLLLGAGLAGLAGLIRRRLT